MTKRNMIIFAVVVGAALAALLLISPISNWFVNTRTETLPEPKQLEVAVENPRLVLPIEAGDAASVYFDLVNRGTDDVIATAVSIEGVDRLDMFVRPGPGLSPAENILVAAGEEVSFAPEKRYLVAAEYGPTVLPGATLQLTITFGDSRSITSPLNVQSALGPSGIPTAPQDDLAEDPVMATPETT